MSLVTSRVALQHRCTIERNMGSADDWGGQQDDWQSHLEDLPCRAWDRSGREPVDVDRTAAFVERGVTLPLGTDVTESDRVSSITSRGAELLDGPMGIEAKLIYTDHIELMLERIR